ncbi:MULTISPECIES: YegJ family protein [Thioclava]|uniref:YegJ family protein n=1 Tax=Thioclava TaxID=285107 RepID=UPI00143B201E|nr:MULTISPECIES: DUF2314 domain-containing protein [Thioclava]
MSAFRSSLACLCIGLCLSLPAALHAQAQDDAVVGYETGDTKMNAAIGQARATYESVFIPAVRARSGSQFMLKAGIDTPADGLEHIWIAPISISAQKITGTLMNEPVHFKAHAGDEITFAPNQISDWSFRRDGKLHGNYTTRVMLPDIPAEQAANLRAQLAPLP